MQHSVNVPFQQCQGPQVTVAQHQHTALPLAPINSNMTTSSGPGLDATHPTATTDEYDEYHNLSEFSFDSVNGVPGDQLMESGHLNEEKLMLPHSQSVGSVQMYDAESAECFDIESGMHDDGSNGSGSSGGSGKSRTGNSKKTGSSKNYIGKQNLFQEFQSEDVAKVRDSENQYIIGKSFAHPLFCIFD